MVGRRSFPFGSFRPIFRGLLLVSGRVWDPSTYGGLFFLGPKFCRKVFVWDPGHDRLPLRLPLIDDLPAPIIVEVKDVVFGFFGAEQILFFVLKNIFFIYQKVWSFNTHTHTIPSTLF